MLVKATVTDTITENYIIIRAQLFGVAFCTEYLHHKLQSIHIS